MSCLFTYFCHFCLSVHRLGNKSCCFSLDSDVPFVKSSPFYHFYKMYFQFDHILALCVIHFVLLHVICATLTRNYDWLKRENIGEGKCQIKFLSRSTHFPIERVRIIMWVGKKCNLKSKWNKLPLYSKPFHHHKQQMTSLVETYFSEPFVYWNSVQFPTFHDTWSKRHWVLIKWHWVWYCAMKSVTLWNAKMLWLLKSADIKWLVLLRGK